MKLFNDRRVILALSGAGLLALLFLAMGMNSLSFLQAQYLKVTSTSGSRGFLDDLFSSQVAHDIYFALLFLVAASLVYLLLKKEPRKIFFRKLVQYVIVFTLLFFILGPLWGDQLDEENMLDATPALSISAADAEVLELDVPFGEGEAVPESPVASPWLVYVFTLLVLLAGAGLIGYTYLERRRPAMKEIADIALAAADDIESGLDIDDAILRCYAEMMEVVKKRRGIVRKEAMTPSEFARWLVSAGMPGTPVRNLTSLFERVRYGGRPSSVDEAYEASDCLRSIAVACGGVDS